MKSDHSQARAKSAAKPAPARISPARRAAFQVLLAVQAGQGNSDTLLHSQFTEGLSPLDRNLATTLVMGVLRWQIALDAAIVPLLTRREEALPPPVATALRLGAFQLRHLDRIPPHAAISESVELCRAANQPQACGMVNAVLRKLVSPALEFAPSSPLVQLALETAHPLWLIERWTKNYGPEVARAIAQAGQQLPTLTLHRADAVSPAPAGFLPGALLSTALRRDSAAPAAEPPAGSFAMDEGSQLVAEIAALPARVFSSPSNATPPQSHYDAGEAESTPAKILDACAAPGGKTLILAARRTAAEILACDSSPARMAALRTRLAGVTNVRYLQADAAALPPALTGFENILCDAPCSGTGTLARNPEIRHRLQPGELVRHAERQRNILRGTLSRLAPPSLLSPAGMLVYATCSLEPEENEDVVHAVLAAEKKYELVDVRLALDALLTAGILLPEAHALLTTTAVKNGCLRTLPGGHPCDGFFAAILSRKQ